MKLLTTYQKKKTIDIVSSVEGSSDDVYDITPYYGSSTTHVKTDHKIRYEAYTLYEYGKIINNQYLTIIVKPNKNKLTNYNILLVAQIREKALIPMDIPDSDVQIIGDYIYIYVSEDMINFLIENDEDDDFDYYKIYIPIENIAN